jgi:hypothetical protein
LAPACFFERFSRSMPSIAVIVPKASFQCSWIRLDRSIRHLNRCKQFFDQAEAEVAAVPGVASVGWAESLPLDFFDAGGLSFEIVGDPAVEQSQRPTNRISNRESDVLLDARLTDSSRDECSIRPTRATVFQSVS